ncbi:MAG: MerC domain-containing protein [Nitrospirales bacterium]|nr:MerC domain-containing protein [Nitrospira sp.]MDR4502576.1 MerC domain-containing protein [Nitrospirales bacterium]
MKTFGLTLSKAGSLASLVCAVHCALTPLALLALPVIAAHSWDGLDVILGGFLAETTEWFFVGIISLLAGFGLLATYPLHRDIRPAYLTAVGLLCLVLSHVWMVPSSAGEIVLDVIGASLIAFAGFWNRRLCHCLGCHTHEHTDDSQASTAEHVA